MRLALIGAALAAGLAAAPAGAEVVSASPSSFQVQAEATVSASPEQVWRALGRVERWWNSAHTFSGEARNMRLQVRAGGCFCETWSGGQSVEHARVVLVMQHEGVRTLRLHGALGPLQDMGVTAVLTFLVAEDPSGAKITMTYRVSGDSALALDALAPLVDGVLNEQFSRLVRFTANGTPD